MPERSKQKQRGSLVANVLRGVTRVVVGHPRLTMWLVLVTSCAAAGYTVAHIRFRTTRADLIDPDAGFHQRWMDYQKRFGEGSDLLVVVEAEGAPLIRDVLDELGSRLERDDLFSHVLYRINTGPMRDKGLQFLDASQLRAARERVRAFRPILRDRDWDKIQLESLVPRLTRQIRERGGNDQDIEPLLRHARLLTASMDRYLVDQTYFTSPWPDMLQIDPHMRNQADDLVYLMNDQGTMGFLKTYCVPREGDFSGASHPIERLRQHIDDVRALYPDHPNLRLSLTGIPVLENDEMQRSQADMINASGISFVAVGILLFVGFRSVRHPMLALMMLLVAMSWAFGYTTLLIGHLNILSVSFAVILIGLGIDFAIHYLTRYLQLRHEGKSLPDALLQTSTGVGPGIVTAAVTTALAFFCATFTNFLGVAELGMIAGGGILLCALATFFVLPALIMLADRGIEPQDLPVPLQGNGWRTAIARLPKVVLVFALAVTGLIGSQAFRLDDGSIEPKLKYDYNLLNLQAAGLESVDVQDRIFRGTRESLLFAVSVADSPQRAIELREQYLQLPTVARVEELATRLPDRPTQETTEQITALQHDLAQLPSRIPDFADSNPMRVGAAMERLYLILRDGAHPIARQTAQITDRFLNRFENMSLRHQTTFLTAYQRRMASKLIGQFRSMANATSLEPIQMADLPAELKARFISTDDQWLVKVYPRDQIWDEEPLERFVKDVRSVDPDCTGTPLQNYEASRQIMASYEMAALYAMAIIALILLLDFLGRGQKLVTLLPPAAIVACIGYTLHERNGEFDPVMLAVMYLVMLGFIAGVMDFRNLRDMFLAMLPPLLGGLMMLGILTLLKIDLNPANLIVLPLVLGIGVDDGVHVLHDFRSQRGRTSYKLSASTTNAIVLTSLTSMIGFGSLMVAAHRGLYSVGLVLSVGVGCCLFTSLVLLPAILTLLGPGEPDVVRSARKADGADAEVEPDRQRHGQRGQGKNQRNRAA